VQTTHPRVLASALLPRRAAVTAVLTVGFAVATALAAQVRIPIPGTPVPITGQTFVVLLAGAAVGSRVGAASQLLYVALGLVGFPVFAGGGGGWAYATGPTLGYLVGFVLAAWLVGRLAEAGRDRSVRTAVPAFLAGNVAIYVPGVLWLWWSVPAIATLPQALSAGVVPFLVGDALKILLAGASLPLAWRLTERSR